MTVVELLKLSAGYLAKHSSDSPRLDAELLLAHSLSVRRLDLYLQHDRPLGEAELDSYRELIRRRAGGEPVAYIVGHKEFMGLDFAVTRDVLVPNPDTEVLVQRAVDIARAADRPVRVADVGTGSGCIAVAIARYASNAEVWATDISAAAVEVASRNVEALGAGDRVRVACCDLMAALEGSFDLVCANLPYLPAESKLPAEVAAQPARALFAGPTGAQLVERLLTEAPPHLGPGGRVLAEIDPAIIEEVTSSARRSFASIRVHRDLAGHERVIEAWCPDAAEAETKA